ncbi:MAG TPA: TRAP transporter substrate-binding protein DctP [Burkholderiales bacterium]|nr:TRAP transporter substrate-binding protein DctP [Burkholderiales bacterium]
MKLRLLTYAAAALLLAAPAVKAAETLSLATWGTSSHPQVKEFTKPFMEAVEKKTNGAIKFKYFPDDQMVKQKFVPNAVPSGTVDISLATLDSWAGRIPEVSVTVMPLWPLSMQETRDKLVPGNPLFDWFDREFQKTGVKILCIFDIGPPVVSTSFELKVPDDIKGKKIRATSKGHAELLQSLAASPVVLSVGEVYQALQRGTVDGAVGGLQGMVGLKHYEVAKYVMASNGVLGTYIHGYVMNLKRFNALPKEQQTIIMTAAADARNAAQDVMINGYQKYLGVAQEKGMKLFVLKKDSPEWNKWQAAAARFNTAQKKTLSPELLRLLGQ